MPVGGDFPEVLAAAQAGGEWAIATLFRDGQPRLLRYLRAQAGDAADDLASETWLDVARNLRSFEGDEDAFRGWVFTIARRRLIDHRRRSGRRVRTVGGNVPEIAGPLDTEAIALGHGALGDAAARRLVASLPDELADIVLLRVVAGLDVAEVAAIVGRRPGTVRVLQHRAMQRLRRELGVTPGDATAMEET